MGELTSKHLFINVLCEMNLGDVEGEEGPRDPVPHVLPLQGDAFFRWFGRETNQSAPTVRLFGIGTGVPHSETSAHLGTYSMPTCPARQTWKGGEHCLTLDHQPCEVTHMALWNLSSVSEHVLEHDLASTTYVYCWQGQWLNLQSTI